MVNTLLFVAATVVVAADNLMPRAITQCPTYPTCPKNDQCTWTDPSNGACFVVACGTDLVGNDIQTVHATSYGDCLNACSVTQGCVAVSYKDNFCCLKDKIPSPVSNTLVDAARISGTPRAEPPEKPQYACSGDITCPYYDNCLYSAGAQGLRQKVFVITCARDFLGGDLSNEYAKDAEACVQACALNGNCVAVSFANETKTCYLKKTVKPALYNSKITGAYLRGRS